MASIITSKSGHRTIQFKGGDGRRPKITLGKVSRKRAESLRAKVEDLVSASITGESPRASTAEWLKIIGDDLHARIAHAGLADPRSSREAEKLGPFTREYIASRTDVKPGTVKNLTVAAEALVGFFGAGRSMKLITPGDAEAFRVHLLGNWSDNTVRRICGRGRQFFRAAMRRGLVAAEPFADIACAVGTDTSRFRFVTLNEIARVLAACPDAEWRVIFALSRFGGLRCTSEHLSLRWEDIDWEHNRMTVRSPKTEHHEGKASRLVPLFPELRVGLLPLFSECEAGTVHVINRYRDHGVNLRTQAHRIIKRAGLEPWPKVFHNMRASRETELCDEYPEHVVCAWIGNSKAVARKHYLHVTDDHWARATRVAVVQKAVQQAAASDRNGKHGEPDEVSKSRRCSALQKLAVPCGTKGYPRQDSNLRPQL